jgi:hypothetical protein
LRYWTAVGGVRTVAPFGLWEPAWICLKVLPDLWVPCKFVRVCSELVNVLLGLEHRWWALSPISVISDIGLSLMSESPISYWESGVRHYNGYRNKVLSDIWYPTPPVIWRNTVAGKYSNAYSFKGCGFESSWYYKFFVYLCQISEWAQMSISEHFRNRNDSFQSDIFVSGITDVNVRCRISPTLRSM